MKIENIYIKRDSEGNITGDIEIYKNGRDGLRLLRPLYFWEL